MPALDALQPALVLTGVALLPAFVTVGLQRLWKRFARTRNRRSPLTDELLRPPGFGLQERIEQLSDDIGSTIAASMLSPVMVFAAYRLRSAGIGQGNPRLLELLFWATGLGLFVYLTIDLIRKAEVRQKYREALAGERATAQLLEPIIAGGGRVLHDVQARDVHGRTFNIDHVVVSAGGVFAVETKHRLKPTEGKGRDQARVVFDGKALRFPDWTDIRSVEQARSQARWLSERLTKATGRSVTARPVLALPGWFVERTAPSDVTVVNPKNCQFMLKPRSGEPPLAADEIRSITFQVEQLCRLPHEASREAVRSKA